jgi:glycosyltransferase involved in cell wall biosynthesis
MELSLVIPAMNEEESLPLLLAEIHAELSDFKDDKGTAYDWEVLLIDDGSSDNTWQVIKELEKKYPQISAWRFQANQGKAEALALGFREASGKFVITMDADLQDNPAEIKPLIAQLEEGFDLISGWKQKRFDPWHKTMPSKLFNLVTSLVAGVRLHDFNCGLKAYRQAVVKNVDVYGDFHRYIPVMAHWKGFRVSEKVVQHRARQYGKSKYGVSRLLSGFLDLLSLVFLHRWANKPLHFFGSIGMIFILLSSVILGYFGIEWLLTGALHVRPLLMLGGFSMIMGIQITSLGFLGEMLSRPGYEHRSFRVADSIGPKKKK